MVRDIHPTGNSSPSNLIVLGSKLLFSANNGTDGTELWVTDGTSAGTQMIKDNHPTGNAAPQSLSLFTGKIYFWANNGTDGTELWVTDGTTIGTLMLKDINPGVNSSFPLYFTEYNGKLYFKANDDTNNYQLWVTDGPSAGTQLLKVISSTGSANISKLIVYNNKLFFGATDGTNGTELWQTDGTTIGTVMVKDINPTASSFPYDLFTYHGKLYFSADADNNGYELYESDGTSAGTTVIAPAISPGGSPLCNRSYMTYMNGSVYFRADYNTSESELWKYTAPAPATVNDIKNQLDFSLYPNPAQNIVTVEAEDKILSIQVKDFHGRTINTVSNTKSIDVSDLANGIYLIQVETSKGTGV